MYVFHATWTSHSFFSNPEMNFSTTHFAAAIPTFSLIIMDIKWPAPDIWLICAIARSVKLKTMNIEHIICMTSGAKRKLLVNQSENDMPLLALLLSSGWLFCLRLCSFISVFYRWLIEPFLFPLSSHLSHGPDEFWSQHDRIFTEHWALNIDNKANQKIEKENANRHIF